MGLALILPRELNPDEAGRGLDSILHERDTGLPRSHRLFDGQWLECILELDTRERPPVNLDPRTWTSCSRTWASVTPVVLNRHFNGKDRWARAAESLKEACRHIGLPLPAEVLLHPVSLVEGVPHEREFPPSPSTRNLETAPAAAPRSSAPAQPSPPRPGTGRSSVAGTSGTVDSVSLSVQRRFRS